ncbi:hypothetical protein BpJC7_28060 [Weizmannia acidilactici]|uniref:Uncharacterized protein n=1 Tax=Weizmannia acidilactici TaxID=2607726 RepID=A0A5J4JHC9_9BACI|nr:prenyltransferase/squalene oxidase repeat-containing protein [Weizmannia acidilactici]GER67763.1 hypothetical protein BpJC4_22340 [Weizmannia acidilactici]GER71503.1 hypothetical protein BpJC7_28060 [Weizmannia acidilactici]GER73640.1 hypothetical protein BpPP18_17070 [Weizmannia acidilactici]
MVGKRLRGLIWGIAFVLAFAVPSHSFAAVSVSKDIADTASYFKSSALNSDFVVAALAKENLLTANEIKQYRSVIKERVNSKTLTGTELDKTIIALKAIGEDPANFEGKNLVRSVFETKEESTTTGYAYDLIALNTDNYSIPGDAPNTPAKIAAKLVDLELPDGGWSWGPSATASDVDSTGMVLTALGTYQDRHDEDVKNAIQDGIKYLKAAEKDNAGFDNWGINSCSTAQAIIGLTSVDVDPTTGDFVKSGTNPVSMLSTFKDTKNGGYKWMATSDASDSFSTEQVLQALVAYDLFQKGDTLYDFTQKSSTGSTAATENGNSNPDSGNTASKSAGSGNSSTDTASQSSSNTASGNSAAATNVIEKNTKEVITKTNTITKNNTITKKAVDTKQTPAKTKKTSNADKKAATAKASAAPAEKEQQPQKVVTTKTTGVSPVHGWVGSISTGVGVILLVIRKRLLGV